MPKKNSYRDLKSKYHDYIIIQKAGCFYDVRQESAVFLSKKFGYKLFSDKTSEYKIGIPVSQIEKVLDYIKQNNYKYVLTEYYEIVEKNDNGISILNVSNNKKTFPIDTLEDGFHLLNQIILNSGLKIISADYIAQNLQVSLEEPIVKNDTLNLPLRNLMYLYGQKMNGYSYHKEDNSYIVNHLIDKNTNDVNIDRKIKYKETIDKIRNFIIEKKSWVDIREIETFFGLKRHGKIDKDDNLSTVAHLINNNLKKEGFKTKRVNYETDYTIFVAPGNIDDKEFITEEQNTVLSVGDVNEIEGINSKFVSVLTKDDANELLKINNSKNYNYEEEIELFKQKFGEIVEEHTNFQMTGKYGELNQYILESYCVLNNFTTRRWISVKKISEDKIIQNEEPISFQITKNNKEIQYNLFNLSQTIEYRTENNINNKIETPKLKKRDLADVVIEFVKMYNGRFSRLTVIKILTGNSENNSSYDEMKNTSFWNKFDSKFANILNSIISTLIRLNKIEINSKNCICIKEDKNLKAENDKTKENLKDFNEIVNLINQGKNIFVTGNAGTGKSFLLNRLKQKYKKKLELTSTTGLAAVNIKGVTIHSWCGVGICKKTIQKCVSDILEKKTLVNKIRKCKLLAIDEISMLKGYTFTYIDQVLRMVREEDAPFGGIQVLLFGDFFQLPPVEQGYSEKDFCFETQTWEDLNLATIKLEKIYRQTDLSFIKALNDIREGKITNDDINLLKSREIDYDTSNSSILHIFSRNDEADNYNLKKFNSLNSKIYSYSADLGVYRGKNFVKEKLNERELIILDIFQKNSKATKTIEFKKGCRVMLLINLDFDKGLINGSCGEITALDKDGITVKFDNGIETNVEKHEFEYYYNDEKVASMTQYPLKLAYAITIHKSQGMTLDNVVVDCNKIFEEGQTYVALSRVRSINGLYLKGFTEDKIKVNKKVVEFYKNLEKK